MKPETINQNLIWKTTKEYFLSYKLFDRIFKDYNIRMERLRKKSFHSRSGKKTFSTREIGSLFEFKKLEKLRNTHLFSLKEHSHQLFRKRESLKGLEFDLYISEAFHEISILKEEEYNLEHYLLKHRKKELRVDEDLVEIQKVFDLKVKRITELFTRARECMDDIFYENRFDKILIRSLYFIDKNIFPDAYSEGLRDILKLMFKKKTPATGYYVMAVNFTYGGFFTQARLAMRRAFKYMDADEPVRERLEQLRDFFEEQKKLPHNKPSRLGRFLAWTEQKPFPDFVRETL